MKKLILNTLDNKWVKLTLLIAIPILLCGFIAAALISGSNLLKSALVCLALAFTISSGGFLGAVYKKGRFEEFLPLTLFALVFVLFISGLFNNLGIGAVAVLLLAALCYILGIIRIAKAKASAADYIGSFLSPALAVYLILALLTVAVVYGMRLHYWDEFTNWADTVKAMFQTGHFSTDKNSYSVFSAYPPAMGLFQYFIQKLGAFFGQDFCEWYLYLGYNLFSFSLFMPMLKKLRYKNLGGLVLSVAFIYFAPNIVYPEFGTTLLIDSFLGLLGGFIFIIPFCYESRFLKLATLCGALFTVILAKDAADGASKPSSFNFIGLDGLFDVISGKDVGYRSSAYSSFIAVTKRDVLPIIIIFVLLLFFGCVLYRVRHKATPLSRKATLLLPSLVGVYLIYAIALLLLYLCYFTEHEAVGLASFSRYMSVIFQMFAFTVFYFVITEITAIKGKEENITGIMIALVIFLVAALSPSEEIRIRTLTERPAMSEYHYNTTQFADECREYIPENSRVYLLSQKNSFETDYDYWVMKYSLRPSVFPSGSASTYISAENNPDKTGIWSINITPEQFAETLHKDYDYLIILKTDEYFTESFKELFENPQSVGDKSIYKIDAESGLLTLVVDLS